MSPQPKNVLSLPVASVFWCLVCSKYKNEQIERAKVYIIPKKNPPQEQG